MQATEKDRAEDVRGGAGALARAAIAEAERRGFAPTPRVFELFFAYLDGKDAELVAAVGELLPEAAGPDLDAVDRIFDAHLSLDDRAARFVEIGQRVERELTTLGDSSARRLESDVELREHLARASNGISFLSRPGSVRQTIRELLETADGYARQTEAFAAQIRASRAKINELSAELKELRESAFSDHLTGLGNRRRFDMTLDLEVEQIGEGGSLSLILADIDRFKRINDGYGHPVGDSLLKHFARLIRQSVSDRDTPARCGGEEFGIILPTADLLSARHLAERIRQALAARSFVVSDTRERLGPVTASFGVAEFREGETPLQLYTRADAALMQAKEGGRNRVVASP